MTDSRTPPADHDARERFIHELDTSFFVEAGAGSGKTSVIVARVVNLVKQGRSLSEIVAITFTEKAAGELRERIRTELSEQGLSRALRDVDAAPIQTIHAFAAGILHERALDAGLDPDFRVLDQLQADLRLAQSWRSWLWSDEAPHDALQRALDLGLELSDLQLAAEHLSRNRDLTAQYTPPGAEAEIEAEGEQRERDSALSDVTEALRAFVEADAVRRLQEGVLSYDDLLLEARNLLVRSPDARRALRRRYRAILIDEFQDTDPLQAQIALLLAGEPDTDDWTQAKPGAGRLVIAGDPKQSIYRFRRADIDIYEQVRGIFQDSPETADILSLQVNFRARPQLVEWHNRVLSRVLQTEQAYPRAQARWESTLPDRSEPGAGVVVIPSQRQFNRAHESRTAEARLVANLIGHMSGPDASVGELPGGDGEAPRRPELRDIAILVRTRTQADLYTAALDLVGIPYHFDSGQGFYQQPEIRAVASLLQALDDPLDEAAVVALLKSPLAAASDAELLELRAAVGDAPLRLDLDSLPASYEGRLRARIAELAELRRNLQRFNLPELIDQIIRASGLLQAQAVGARPAAMRQRQANLRMLVQRAAHFADNREDSLRPFIRWLSQRGVRSLPESESATTEADDDAVRILTIHQAKGLEFPIVILPKLQDQPFFGADFIIDRPNERIEFKLGDDRSPFRTPGYAAALRRDRVYADAEARRLLYVAATRARDWLILPSFPADSLSRRDSFHSFLDDAAPHWLQRDADPDAQVLSPRSFDAAPPKRTELYLPPLDDLRESWQLQQRAALDGGLRQIDALTPSGMAHAAFEELEEATDSQADDRWDDSIDPLDFGNAVHESLEAADLSDLEVTRRRSARACRRRQIAPQLVWPHIERAWRSDILRRATRSEVVHRELPLATYHSSDDGATIIEGIADLVFLDQNGWVIVDYKSDAEIPLTRREYYFGQVQTYVSMLQQAGMTVAEAYLLLTATGEAVAVPLP